MEDFLNVTHERYSMKVTRQDGDIKTALRKSEIHLRIWSFIRFRLCSKTIFRKNQRLGLKTWCNFNGNSNRWSSWKICFWFFTNRRWQRWEILLNQNIFLLKCVRMAWVYESKSNFGLEVWRRLAIYPKTTFTLLCLIWPRLHIFRVQEINYSQPWIKGIFNIWDNQENLGIKLKFSLFQVVDENGKISYRPAYTLKKNSSERSGRNWCTKISDSFGTKIIAENPLLQMITLFLIYGRKKLLNIFHLLCYEIMINLK